MLDVRFSQRLFATPAFHFTQQLDGQVGYRDIKTIVGNTGFVTATAQGPGETSDGSLSYTPLPSERIDDGRANFTTYRTTLAGAPTEVSYYRVGSGNSELKLTYLSFATWTWSVRDMMVDSSFTNVSRYCIPYGFATPRGLLAARTGSASYAGVVYGIGTSYAGARYEIGGTSQFNVDFASAQYSGSLALSGKASTGGDRNFGAIGFNGTMNEGLLVGTTIAGSPSSSIVPVFYGTAGQEIGAPFALIVGTPDTLDAVNISGIAVAKQR